VSIPVPAKPTRKPFAAGDYLTRYPEGAPYAFRIDGPNEKPRWKARIPSAYGSKPPFPGSTIRFEEAYYEVALFRWKSGTFPRFFYYLTPWEERFPIRETLDYTIEECEKERQERKKQIQTNRKAGSISLFTPLAGLLPGEDQKRIEMSYGIPALRLTFLSALPLFIIGGFALIFFLASQLAGGFGQSSPVARWIAPYLPWGIYLFIESWIRIVASAKFGLPMGSMVVFLPLEIWRAIRREFDPAYRQKVFESLRGKRARDLLINGRDEVLEIYGQECDLEVVSLLPKPHWNPLVGVLYDETWYVPIDSRTIREGTKVRYHFQLRKAPDHHVFRSTCNYAPEEVRELFRQKRRRDLGTWAMSLSILWGFLAAPDQKRLAAIYDFDPVRATRESVVLAIAIAATVLATGLFAAKSGGTTLFDAAAFLFAAYLLAESFSRLHHLAGKDPTGSLIGILIRPLAFRLLEG